MVPDRERPGTTATAWPTPTSRASSMVADLGPFLPRAIRSEKKRMQPVTARAQPTKMVLPYSPSTLSLMGRMTNRGRVATMIIRISRPLGGSRFICLRFSRENTQAMRWKNSFTNATMSFQ